VLDSFLQFASPSALVWLVLGTTLGVVVGAVPGLTGAMLITLTVPLTFSLEYRNALILLVSMYTGSVAGGLISATLLRMPGTPASVITTLDGYPLAKKGRPGRALGLGIGASFLGGVISWIFLIALSGPIATWSTKLGPFELFSLVMIALVLIASVSSGSLTKGLFSGALGMLATVPGTSPATGELRWTFGVAELANGFALLPVLIGLFAVSQLFIDVFRMTATRGESSDEPEVDRIGRKGVLVGPRDWMRHIGNVLRSSLLGTGVGILPGVGANVGSVVAYSTARAVSKTPEEFGEGSEEGIVASETANSATVGGALIPLVALGIPGSVIDAILLGALVLHGLQPGPLLFAESPDAVYTITTTFLLSNVVMLVILLTGVHHVARWMSLPRAYLIPTIFVLCVVGSFALSNRFFDVWTMLGFAALGIVLRATAVPLAPFVIGFVLAPVAEENFSAALQISGGDYAPFLTRPLSLVFLLISATCVVLTLRRRRRTSSSA